MKSTHTLRSVLLFVELCFVACLICISIAYISIFPFWNSIGFLLFMNCLNMTIVLPIRFIQNIPIHNSKSLFNLFVFFFVLFAISFYHRLKFDLNFMDFVNFWFFFHSIFKTKMYKYAICKRKCKFNWIQFFKFFKQFFVLCNLIMVRSAYHSCSG